MAQILLPDSTVSAGSWTGGHAEMAADDGSFAVSDAVTSGPGSIIEVGLASGTDPASSADHTIRVRWVCGGGGGAHMDTGYVALYQGSTLIGTLSRSTILETTEEEDTYTLSGTEADSITDYTDLRFRIQSTEGRRSLQVDLVQLEIPDAGGADPIDLTHLAGSQFFEPSFVGDAVIDLDHLAGSQFFSPSVGVAYTPPGTITAADVIVQWDARNLAGDPDDLVASVPDDSPMEQDPLAQATSGLQPKISDSGFGGVRSLEFDGVDNQMTASLDQTYSGDFAIIHVVECLTFPAISTTAGVTYSTGSVPNKIIHGFDDQGPSGHVFMVTGGAPEDHETDTLNLTYMEDTPSRYVICQYLQNSGPFKVWENGAVLFDYDEGEDLNNMGAFIVGSREDSTRYGHFRLGFLMAVKMDGTTGEADLEAAISQLMTEFNVTSFISSPIDLTHLAGSQFFSPSVVASDPLGLDHLDGTEFFAISVEGAAPVELDLLDGSQFFTLLLVGDISLTHLAGSEFFEPTIGVGIDLEPLEGSQFFEPSLVFSDITLDLLDGSQFFAPEIGIGIFLDHFAGSEFFEPQIDGNIHLAHMDTSVFPGITVVDPSSGVVDRITMPLQGVEF